MGWEREWLLYRCKAEPYPSRYLVENSLHFSINWTSHAWSCWSALQFCGPSFYLCVGIATPPEHPVQGFRNLVPLSSVVIYPWNSVDLLIYLLVSIYIYFWLDTWFLCPSYAVLPAYYYKHALLVTRIIKEKSCLHCQTFIKYQRTFSEGNLVRWRMWVRMRLWSQTLGFTLCSVT